MSYFFFGLLRIKYFHLFLAFALKNAEYCILGDLHPEIIILHSKKALFF